MAQVTRTEGTESRVHPDWLLHRAHHFLATLPHWGCRNQAVPLGGSGGAWSKNERTVYPEGRGKFKVMTLAWPLTLPLSPVLQACPALHLTPHHCLSKAVPS